MMHLVKKNKTMTTQQIKTKLKSYNLVEISNQPEQYAKAESITKLAQLIWIANQLYYNTGEPILSDYVYDILRDTLQERSPKHPVLKQIGAPVAEKEKVKLPYWMGSMDKIKPDTGSVPRWIAKYKGPYFISEKLDGISALLVFNHTNEKINLYTRGNGTYGQNITHLLKYIKFSEPNMKNQIGTQIGNQKIAVRGELIMTKDVYQKKYAKDNSNARSLVSGLVNSKTLKPNALKDVQLVMYEVIYPSSLIASQQFQTLEKIGFKVAQHQILPKVDDDILKSTLLEFKKNSEFEIDGIIVADNHKHSRNVSGNPKYSIAFKMVLNEQTANVKVINVEWNASKHGYMIPRIQFESVNIGGAVLSFTTGFNGKYIVDNKIGKGAVLKIIRSGDVIPYILEVIKPARTVLMPKAKYHWTESGIDIVLDNINDNQDVLIKRLIHFFKKVEIENLSVGLITRLVENGFNNVSKILSISVEDLLGLPGIKQRMANKLYTNIHKVIDKPIHPSILMAASNVFGVGFGVKKFNMIFKIYPDLLRRNPKQISVEMITGVEGFSELTGGKFVKGLPQFHQFLREHQMLKVLDLAKQVNQIENLEQSSGKLKGQSIVITGFRDKDLEVLIKSEGGKIASGVTGNTTIVIAKDVNSTSSKIKKAKQKKIPIMSVEQFRQKYKF